MGKGQERWEDRGRGRALTSRVACWLWGRGSHAHPTKDEGCYSRKRGFLHQISSSGQLRFHWDPGKAGRGPCTAVGTPGPYTTEPPPNLRARESPAPSVPCSQVRPSM